MGKIVVKIRYNNGDENCSKMGDKTNKDTCCKWGYILNRGKCSENKINSKWGYCKKCGGISTWGILDFIMGDFECSPFFIAKWLTSRPAKCLGHK